MGHISLLLFFAPLKKEGPKRVHGSDRTACLGDDPGEPVTFVPSAHFLE